jgi:anti-anti-sigma regulatory factor
MNSEIKGNVIVYSIEENLDDIFTAFFYDDLISFVNSKYFNYVIDIAPRVKIKSIKFVAVLLSLSDFCSKNKGGLIISTTNNEFNSLLKLTKIADNFKIFDALEKAMIKFSKK